eukprot:CAMPEP_0114527696 /NCGR_PEP_ID=MMETSP0109-20121206/23771_1 /TAXON_ID=29199 /ORGANISM="Chlorarachnion reptans, Strain CCCM449" /LENGTH=164 /DNA_ID=CAMNT_0001709713 /DNA_START=21 /DNA_END=512 /DNA_ORIENTATION=-
MKLQEALEKQLKKHEDMMSKTEDESVVEVKLDGIDGVEQLQKINPSNLHRMPKSDLVSQVKKAVRVSKDVMTIVKTMKKVGKKKNRKIYQLQASVEAYLSEIKFLRQLKKSLEDKISAIGLATKRKEKEIEVLHLEVFRLQKQLKSATAMKFAHNSRRVSTAQL